MVNKKAFEIVAKEIEDYIVSSCFAPGTKIKPERELASMFSVSRSTVRLAISYLISQDKLVSKQGSGTFVSDSFFEKKSQLPEPNMDTELYATPMEISEARVHLECEIARLCAIRASDAICNKLTSLMAEYDKINGEQYYDQLNESFHMIIAEGTGNRVLVYLQKQMMRFLKNPLYLEMADKRLPDVKYSYSYNVNQHKQLANAIISHDPITAERLMREHLSGISEEIVKIFSDSI